MWVLKNDSEYCVFAYNRKQAIIKFKTIWDIDVKPYMIVKIL